MPIFEKSQPVFEKDETREIKVAAREPFEALAERKGIELWKVRAAAAYHRWAIGKEVTETELDEAVAKVLGVTLSGG